MYGCDPVSYTHLDVYKRQGGGKSTVARLIARFWDVTEGAVLIGGVDIRKLPLKQLADTVSFVTQDIFCLIVH